MTDRRSRTGWGLSLSILLATVVVLDHGAVAHGAEARGTKVRGEHHGGPAGSVAGDATGGLRARLEAIEAAYLERLGVTRSPTGETPALYQLHPQAGNVSFDLWPNSFVDLDPTAGALDFDCGAVTYDTHRGNDTDLKTFTEQVIGVPVLAALDGTVVDVHDGEPDMNLECVEPSNYVILHHGGTHFTWYLHLKQGSVAVAVDDVVTAGTQIGLTASSGCSFWPHLHFESRLGGSHFEPNAGPCRPGPSGWVRQEPLRRDTFLTEFTITADDLTLWDGAPIDTSRTGHLLLGTIPHFWLMLKNLPADSTWRTRFRDPSGATVLDESGDFGGNPYFRSSVWWQRWFLDLDATGLWTVIYDVNGTTLVEAPFEVVASAGEIVNRPPHAVSLTLDPATPRAGEVLFCRVDTPLTLDDPDYDVVYYRYEWRLNAVLIRSVTHAGQADVLAREVLSEGETVECTVFPTDGELGPPAQVLTTVGGPCPGGPGACIFVDGFESGDVSAWN